MKNKSKEDNKSVGSTTGYRHFYDLFPKKESRNLTKILAFQIASQAGPFAHELKKLILADDYLGLLTYDIHYSDYLACDRRFIAAARQVLALYSKDSELRVDGVNPKINCLKGFIETEEKCRSTNDRIFKLMETEELLFREYPFVFRVARKISAILKECPTLDAAHFTFGPGSTCNIPKKSASPFNKLNTVMQSSSHLLYTSHGHLFLNEFHAIQHLLVEYAVAVFGMVSKNALTLRTTVTEPTLNMPAQKFLGKQIRKRLLDYGLDLKKGQFVNQDLALLGSINGEIATVDAKNASNTVSIAAVYLGLIQSKDWFELLDSFRSPLISFKDGTKPYSTEMFSSMGNGFTFELETLLFYAISLVACEDVGADTSLVKTYGDDMIVPVEAYDTLVSYLSFYGFSVNVEKTFTTGPFRESCGKDYFFGTNIRPFYKKDQWTIARLVAFLNHDGDSFHFLNQHLRAWLIRTYCPDVTIGPLNCGSGHLVPYHLNELTIRGSGRIHRSVRQRMKSGDAPGFTFITQTKVTLRQLSHKAARRKRMKTTLYPLYCIHNRPELRKIYTNAIRSADEHFDVFGNLTVPEDSFFTIKSEEKIDASLEADPYVLPGGWRSEETKMYFVNFPMFPITVAQEFYKMCRMK